MKNNKVFYKGKLETVVGIALISLPLVKAPDKSKIDAYIEDDIIHGELAILENGWTVSFDRLEKDNDPKLFGRFSKRCLPKTGMLFSDRVYLCPDKATSQTPST